MLKVVLGQVEGVDSAALAASVVAQCEAQLGEARPSAGILFAAAGLDHQRIHQTVREAFPEIALVGCSTRGEFSTVLGYSEDSVSLVLFVSDVVEIRGAVGRGVSGSPRQIAVDTFQAAREGLAGEPVFCLIFPDGRRFNNTTILEAISGVAEGCPVFGGSAAGAEGSDEGTYQYFGDEVLQDALPLMLFAGPISIAHNISNSWEPVGQPAEVTDASGGVVRRIGERTALGFFHHYLGDHATPASEFPLAVFESDAQRFYLRVPASYNRSDGSIRYSGDVPEGATVQLTEAVREHILADTTEAAQQLAEPVAGDHPCLALAFSCNVRRQVLGTRTAEELAILRTHLPDTPILGFYGFGEFGPSGQQDRFHNSTLVTLLLRSLEAMPRPVRSPARPEAPDTSFLQRRLERATQSQSRLERVKDQNAAMLRTINTEVETARRTIAEQNDTLHQLYTDLGREKQRVDELLQNILPADVADELKRTKRVKPVHYEAVTVLFTDFQGFTRLARQMTPAQLIAELDHCFSCFDEIVGRYDLEKLKTIGDAYMCAGGIPGPLPDHPGQVVQAALEMQAWMQKLIDEREAQGRSCWRMRVGIHTGPLVAGVIGQRKFAYDIWGDTVNIAARMESSGEPGQVNISQATYECIRDRFVCTYRGKIPAKSVGEVAMYFVEGLQSP
jgi:class 3 adenylate cyclase